MAGHWRYVHRAIDQFGQVIDVFVSAPPDAMAARRFFEQAIRATKVTPMEVATDQAPAYRPSWRSCWRRRGIALSSMATTALRLITAD